MKKILIVDGNSIVNRAFYGIRPLSTKSGLPTNAVYGFITILHKHIEALKPEYMVCAFDVHHPTFRHKMYSEYKGTRKGMPDELRVQMPYAKKAASALGFKVIECPGFEADDIIGTVAHIADEREECEAYILTGDRDSLQLITESTKVILVKTKGDLIYTEKVFFDEYGVTPSQFVDVKALMGDSSDNIPGVAGIGEKTALKLISTAGSLDELYSSPDFFSQSASLQTKLSSGRDSAYLSRTLALISRDAPICDSVGIFDKTSADIDSLRGLCEELEFSALIKKFGLDKNQSQEVVEEKHTVSEEAVSDICSMKFESPVSVYYLPPELSIFDGEKAHLCKNVSEADFVKFLSENAIVCHDFKKLLRTLHISGESIKCIYDTMLAGYLIMPGKGKYLLEDLALEYLAYTPESISEKAEAVFSVWKETERILKEYDMLSLMNEIEIPLASVLAEMEEVGFKIDPDGIRAYAKVLKDKEDAVADAIWLAAGHDFNINSPKQLGEVLFEEIGLPYSKKTKTGYSTDAETLEYLKPYHTIVSDVLFYRQISKLRGTYGETLADQADENGRIHTLLNQTGTATGRLASSEPNLQNIPVRADLGRELRKYFIAEDGYMLVDADYSQIELRVLASLSADAAMIRAFTNGEDIHTATAAEVFRVDVDDITPELRRRAKAVNFGIVYGIGEFSLAKDLGISRKQAKEYIENYLSTYSGVDKYLRETVENAKRDGYTLTAFGRRRNIPELSASNRNLRAFGERVAMNSPIQGSAADIIKIAMINVSRSLKEEGIDARLIMQVHDELIIEAREDVADKASEILIREMENAVKLLCPLLVDSSMGKSWYDAK